MCVFFFFFLHNALHSWKCKARSITVFYLLIDINLLQYFSFKYEIAVQLNPFGVVGVDFLGFYKILTLLLSIVAWLAFHCILNCSRIHDAKKKILD